MVLIKTKKGLDIPLKGKPIELRGEIHSSALVGIDLNSFHSTKLKLLKSVGDHVEMGEVIAFDKEVTERKLVSFVSGKLINIIRGEKRRPLSLVIEKNDDVKHFDNVDPTQLSTENLVQTLADRGAFTLIRKRPCNTLADPQKLPRSIFVQGIDSAPFMPLAHLHVEGNEERFEVGLKALEKIACGNVHLVMPPESLLSSFCDNVTLHAHVAIGPHPIANPSLHIEKIDPITSFDDVVWTLHVADVVLLGSLLMGQVYNKRLIGIGGEGIKKEARGFYWVEAGCNIKKVLEGKTELQESRIVSGNPITGREVSEDGFLGLQDKVVAVLSNKTKRSWIHFCRLGLKRYTSSRTYLSRLFGKPFSMNTQLHGEERAFLDGRFYDKVMPLEIPTMPLLKAILAEDFDLAVELGLLEVEEEDFALTSFVCPSKLDHIAIVKKGLQHYANLYLN